MGIIQSFRSLNRCIYLCSVFAFLLLSSHQAAAQSCLQPYDEEKIECPKINCQKENDDFVERVKKYYNYSPPSDNRSVFLNKSYHDYEINTFEERTRGPGYNMKQPTGTVPDTVISEPEQDNRWRDACLMGSARIDSDYQVAQRKLMGDEEPFPGVVGSKPVYNTSGSLNCMPPKNTERGSPLRFDNGWRYRNMCPGEQKLYRVERDQYNKTADLFAGEFGCLAPLPKCKLQSDWKRDSTDWEGKEYYSYKTRFGNALTSFAKSLFGEGSLRDKLKKTLSRDQFRAVEDLMETKKSADPKCKPAFWVRLMLDSCANQYILQKTMHPNYIMNPDGAPVGLSPRRCQPFKAELIPADEEEYRVHDYLKRSYNALLQDSYMPWFKYDRFVKDRHNVQANRIRNRKWPERQIEWPRNAQNQLRKGLSKFSGDPSINDYAAHPVERIIDPINPFSPRYDIAETMEGLLLTDRNLFGKATESSTRIGLGQEYKCIPSGKKGYFEFGCTIYCSAVEVDLLRFRYKDYRLCMGCRIDANEEGFWDEYEANRKYYRKEFCSKAAKNSNCSYGDEVCNACHKKRVECAKYAASCLVGCDPNLQQKCTKWTKQCKICGDNAKGEALERTRKRTNDEYGKTDEDWWPSSAQDSWPVCSTRIDHDGDEDLCKQAQEEYGCKKQGRAASRDPNIARRSVSEAQECIGKELKDICHDAAKPVYSMNFLKIRSRKGDFRTDQPQSEGSFRSTIDNLRRTKADEDPAQGNGFREYFGNRRPYMRWWDTGKEAFQMDDRPDYWCDWGQNDAVIGVGRDYNSIHGRKAQLCRFGGGDGIGGNCFKPDEWKQGQGVPDGRKFPSLAGSEWAELKMYQANCMRHERLNCLCQYEKTFKVKSSEDKALYMMGGLSEVIGVITQVATGQGGGVADVYKELENYSPLSWRGYASTPFNRDTRATSPAISLNQQFPYLFADPSASFSNPAIITGGLDKARIGDIIIYPAGSGVLPHVAIVTDAHNLETYDNDIQNIPDRSRWIRVQDANNGKYPDACGVTSLIGNGPVRTLYASKDDMPDALKALIEQQVTSTYYCDDPAMGKCVERRWDDLILYRPSMDLLREPK